MIVFYFLIVALAFYQSSFSRVPDSTMLARERTDSVKGIFILFVFLRHIFPYIEKYKTHLNVPDKLFCVVDSYLAQLIVVMFLFFSGYGVMEGFLRKGSGYVSSFPRKRILATILNFMVAVGVFLAINCILGRFFSFEHCLFSLLGWKSVGNSNWYIFCIVICYIIFYLAFSISGANKKHIKEGVILAFIGLLAYDMVMSYYKGSHWFNTVACFLAGIIFSWKKEQIVRFFERNYILSFVASVFLFVSLSALFLVVGKQDQYAFVYNLVAVSFSIVVVLVMMKWKIENNYLLWLGKNLFPLYIYQRVPMLVFDVLLGSSFVGEFSYVFVVISFLVTILLAYSYRYVAIKL